MNLDNRQYSREVLIKRIIKQIRPYWAHLTGIFILGIIAIPLALIKPFSISLIIDSAFGNHPMPSAIRLFFPNGYHFTFDSIIIIATALAVISALIQNIFALASWILFTYTGEKIVLKFRTRLFNHIQHMSLAYHDKIVPLTPSISYSGIG